MNPKRLKALQLTAPGETRGKMRHDNPQAESLKGQLNSAPWQRLGWMDDGQQTTDDR